MSCFIVDYKDVDNTLNLVNKLLANSRTGLYFKSEFERIFYVNLLDWDYHAKYKVLNELGKKILDLNFKAYNGRYTEDDKTYINEYKFNDDLKVSDMQGLKSLHCIIYQCSEDGAVDTELYKQLNDLKNKIQYYLLACSDEYEEATWGDCYEYASR